MMDLKYNPNSSDWFPSGQLPAATSPIVPVRMILLYVKAGKKSRCILKISYLPTRLQVALSGKKAHKKPLVIWPSSRSLYRSQTISKGLT